MNLSWWDWLTGWDNNSRNETPCNSAAPRSAYRAAGSSSNDGRGVNALERQRCSNYRYYKKWIHKVFVLLQRIYMGIYSILCIRLYGCLGHPYFSSRWFRSFKTIYRNILRAALKDRTPWCRVSTKSFYNQLSYEWLSPIIINKRVSEEMHLAVFRQLSFDTDHFKTRTSISRPYTVGRILMVRWERILWAYFWYNMYIRNIFGK